MWDTLIIEPMTNALLLLYSFLGNNFLLAIAVFTLLIRLITLPLNLRQQKTSLQMQELQPQIQAIQKKYRDNPARMQEEFKKIGYNPAQSLSGCLPLLLQFPILIGLYQAIIILLGSTPQALFQLEDIMYGWVQSAVDVAAVLPVQNQFLWMNLGQPDPVYILPALVFATMFLQQKLLTPTRPKSDAKGQQEDNPMASMTQSMQYTMPIMFTFFSLTFPAGLSIYFILSNIIGIIQGYLTKSAMDKERAAASQPEAITLKEIAEGGSAEGAAKNPNGRQPAPRKSPKSAVRKRRRAKR
ncbi:MAG: YidC/Oxa1 family membrane protein insertase [Candidatus Promineifilaceae bacterium]